MRERAPLKVGLLSDTHGLLRPEARAQLISCDYIVHGGDVGDPKILEELSALAPLTVVRGNNDTERWAKKLKPTELIRLGGVFVHVLHDLKELDLQLAANKVSVVVSGHSHKPKIEERSGVLYVNPGSCGPRRFKLPISMGELLIDGSEVKARTFELHVS